MLIKFKKALLLICCIAVILSSVPLNGFVGLELPEIHLPKMRLDLPALHLPDLSSLFASKALAADATSDQIDAYTHDPRFATGYEIASLIDVSFQNGTVDWMAVAADGIEYAMIRIGYRGYGESGLIREDTRFETNIRDAQAAGIKVGVYFNTQATNNTEAIEEADFVLQTLSGYDLQLPVAFQCEYAQAGASGYTGRFYEANLSKDETADLCLAFCDRIVAGGYDAMIYSNPFMFNNHISVTRIDACYPVWLAAYRTATNYDGNYIMWQYTSTGSVNGVRGNVDKSFYYIKQSVPDVTSGTCGTNLT